MFLASGFQSFISYIGDSTEGCFKLVFDRRAVVFSSFGLLAGAFLKNADDGLAVASEFADSNFLHSTTRSFLLRIRDNGSLSYLLPVPSHFSC